MNETIRPTPEEVAPGNEERCATEEGSASQRCTLSEAVETANGRAEMRLLSGEEYAKHKEIVIENPLTEAEFNKAWEARQEIQAKDDFEGMVIPAEFRDQIWDYVQYTFRGKDENLSGEALETAINTVIEKEAVFFKTLRLDTVERNGDESPKYRFPDGSFSEGDYLDTLANGDPEIDTDNIDPELLAYLRATNTLGLGKEADNGRFDMETVKKQYEDTIRQLRALNIQNLDSFRANIDKLGDSPTPAQAMQLLQNGEINNAQTAPPENVPSNLWDLIKSILEYITGQSYTGFGNNSDRYGGENTNLAPGEAVASNQFLNKTIEELPNGPRKQLLMTAAGDLGKTEGDRTLMAATSRAGGISAPAQPWCMAWIQKILGQVGNGAARKTAWARDGLKMGTSSTANPQPGDLVVVARGNGGHIGFFLGTDRSGKPIIIGGNQGDKVSVKVERRSLLGIVNITG